MSDKLFVVQQNDFGADGAVLIGVCKMVDPSLEVYVNSSLPQYDVKAASGFLAETMRFWPKETVFVSVVDPGVGTARRGCVALTKDGSYIVTPDNGSLSQQMEAGIIVAVREIDETVNRLKGTEECSIFHGRDVFAYTAARLASGIIDFEGVGPEYPVEEIIVVEEVLGTVAPGEAHGFICGAMIQFGNLETNIKIADFEGAGFESGTMVRIVIKHKGEVKFDQKVSYQRSFGFVDVGVEVLYNSISTFIGLGLNMESFMEKYGVRTGEDWTIDIYKD